MMSLLLVITLTSQRFDVQRVSVLNLWILCQQKDLLARRIQNIKSVAAPRRYKEKEDEASDAHHFG